MKLEGMNKYTLPVRAYIAIENRPRPTTQPPQAFPLWGLGGSFPPLGVRGLLSNHSSDKKQFNNSTVKQKKQFNKKNS
jgi:hypothetical protein